MTALSRTTALLLTVGIALIATGCQTTGDPTKAPRSSKEQIYLRKGMASEEIVALLGEPLDTKTSEDTLGEVETWLYEESRETITLVQADTREVPYVHPITGAEMMITEPVTKQKVDSIVVTTKLFIFEGKLIGWDVDTREDTSWRD